MSRDRIRPQAFLIRVELQGILPPIWREILVPPSDSFWDLHVAIQDAMGWLDYHLHAFRIQDPHTGEEVEIGIPDEESFAERIFAGWEHQVLLKEIVPAGRGAGYPVCVGGERACPPEDCGGIWGYQKLLEAINEPANEEHDEMLQWLGGGFDSERFSPAAVKFDDPIERWKQAFES